MGKSRWEERDLNLLRMQRDVGPGQYDCQEVTALVRKNNPEQAVFQSRIARLPYLNSSRSNNSNQTCEDNESEQPDLNYAVGSEASPIRPFFVDKSFNKGKFSKQFGSGSQRFLGKDTIVDSQASAESPGPGWYFPEVSQEFLDNMKNEIVS